MRSLNRLSCRHSYFPDRCPNGAYNLALTISELKAANQANGAKVFAPLRPVLTSDVAAMPLQEAEGNYSNFVGAGALIKQELFIC
jgi:hypothetical protein